MLAVANAWEMGYLIRGRVKRAQGEHFDKKGKETACRHAEELEGGSIPSSQNILSISDCNSFLRKKGGVVG